MSGPFDPARLRQTRQRWPGRADAAGADFLHSRAALSLAERLEDIQRPFPDSLHIGLFGAKSLLKYLQTRRGARNVTGMGLSAPENPPVPFLVACEEFLPLAPQSFDLITGLMTLHTVNDLPGALIQLRRALRPDGAFLAVMAGGETLADLRAALLQAETELYGGASPRVMPFADKQQMGALMQRAGFALPVIDSEKVTVTYATLYDLMKDLRHMGQSASLLSRPGLPPRGRRFFDRAQEIYKHRHSDGNGRLVAVFELIYMIGWSPAPGQQKPLRPGSARSRLADALKTSEVIV